MESRIRDILRNFAKLPVDVDGIARDADLYRLGLTSHASVNVMLGLEDEFDVEFPDALLRRQTFESIQAVAEALESLGVEDPVA